MTTRHNDNLFSRLSAPLKDDEKVSRDDEPMRITRGRTYVYQQAMWAATLLEDLAHGVEPSTRLPAEVLNTCEALCFTNAQKGGFGITGGSGYGFIIKRMKHLPDGSSKWSPPFFFTISQAGMGVALGYQHSQTVMALASQSSIAYCMQGGVYAGADLGFYSTDGASTGMAAGILGWRQQRSQNSGGMSYSMVKGAYTEYGVHGSRIVPDWSTNSKLYEYTNGEDVLNGNVTRRFPETDVLYQVINHLSKQASSVPAAPPSLASASNASAVTTATETPAAEDSNQKNQLYANQA